MVVDILVLGLTMLFGLVGYLTGFWSQLVRLLALLGAYLLAGTVGGAFAGNLARGLEVPPLVGRMGAVGLAFLVLYLLLSTCGWAVLRSWRRRRRLRDGDASRRRGQVDRWAGLALGAAKVFVMLYLVLCVAVLAEKPLARSLGRQARVLRQSRLAALARRHNLLAGLHLPVVGNLEGLTRLASDPALQRKAARDPRVRRLLEHPQVRALAGDRALQAAARRNDISALLANPRLNRLLQDPEIHRLLQEIDLSDLH